MKPAADLINAPAVDSALNVPSKFPKRLWAPAFLIALGLFIFAGSATAPPALLDDADSTHAEVAREMAATGDWVSLQMDGIRYYEKAPLLYWMIALSFRLFGVTEFSARIPMVLSALLAILAVWALASRMFGDREGFYSGVVFATCVGPFLFTRILIPDLLITALLCWSIYFLVRGLDSPERRPASYLGIFAASALAFLTKSMIGAVFPALIILIFLVITRRLGEIRRMRLITGCLIFLALVVPWHLLAAMRNEHFLWFHFINEQVYRYLGLRYPKDYDTVPLPVFYALHLLWLFPWTFCLPAAFRYIPRKLAGFSREESMTLLLIVWVLIIVGFFSLSTRQEYYTLPAIPALAVLCGRVLSDLERGLKSRYITGAYSAMAFLGLCAGVITLLVVKATSGVVINGDISSTLTRNEQYYALSLGHIFDLTPESFAALRTPLIGAGSALLIGTVLALLLYLRGRRLWSSLALASMMAAVFFCSHEAMKVFEPYLSSKPIAMTAAGVMKPDNMLFINGEYESGSTLNFYTGQPLFMLGGRTANLEFGSYLKGAPRRFFDDEGFRELWRGTGRVFIVSDDSKLGELRQIVEPSPSFVLYASGGKTLLSNAQ